MVDRNICKFLVVSVYTDKEISQIIGFLFDLYLEIFRPVVIVVNNILSGSTSVVITMSSSSKWIFAIFVMEIVVRLLIRISTKQEPE